MAGGLVKDRILVKEITSSQMILLEGISTLGLKDFLTRISVNIQSLMPTLLLSLSDVNSTSLSSNLGLQKMKVTKYLQWWAEVIVFH